MKRKFLTLFLALAASVGTIFAQSGTWGTNCTWKVENGVLTFSGTGALANMTETIAPWANYSPTSAIVNEGITSVGGRIFQGCSLLTEVTLAQSVTALGDRPFNNCSKIVTIICKAVTPPTCNTNTFYSIDKTKVTIYVPGKAYGAYQHADVWIDFADNFKAIPYGTCGDKLTWKVENGVLTISGTGDMWDFINEHPDEGWELCEPTKLVIEEGVTSIGKYAFDLCEKVDSVFIPSTVTKIGTHGLENKAIKIITCLAIVPPTCEVAAFTAENKTIYVPLESLEDYKNADIWKSNSKILPITGLKIYATLDDTGTKLTLDYTNDPEGKAVDFWPSELFPNVTTMELKPSMQEARPTKLDSWFDNYTKLTTIEHLEYLNTSEVTDMSYQFQNCWALKELNLSTFDTKNVTNMEVMFYGCEALESLNLTGWNTEKVTNMKSMFGYCEKLTELDLTSFNTEKTENVEYMFQECKELTTIYSNSDWTTPNRPIKSERMFEGCVKLVGGNGTAYDATKIDHTYARPDKKGQPGYFTAKATGIDNVSAAKRNEATKFIRNGELFILRDGKTYSITGQEVK